MTTSAANPNSISFFQPVDPVLFLAFELCSRGKWKLAFTNGPGQKPRIRNIDPDDTKAIQEEIALAKERFELPEDCEVISCYEAGRNGHWLHRFLESISVKNLEVDSSSIEVNRRKRKAKTDRLDATKLVSMLIRWFGGEDKVWSVVAVPSDEDEDARQLERLLQTLKKEKTRMSNRITSLLCTQGIALKKVGRGFPSWLSKVVRWDGSPIPQFLGITLLVFFELMTLLWDKIAEIEKKRRELLKKSKSKAAKTARKLKRMKAIGMNGAWVLSTEIFAWRSLKNRKKVGSIVGLTGTPFQSGGPGKDQGIDKSGVKAARGIAIELAWCWIRYQPNSALTRWFNENYAKGGKRQRKKGIVALARKLMIALWRWVEQDIVPDGAELKA
jgi:transposase